MFKIEEFKIEAMKKSREELLRILKSQDEDLFNQVERIEWVFRNKLSHLAWNDGSPILERDLTKEEIIDLIDPPFQKDDELTKAGFTIDQQRQAFIALDPVLWARHYLNATPRAYQVLILRNKRTRKILRSGRRLGKALHIDTPIPTPNGWRTMKDLEPGDKVFDETGKSCNVTFATDVQWNRDCYRVSFSDGSSLIADADHQWTVDTKSSRKARSRAQNPRSKPITLTTKDMLDSLYVWCGNKLEVNYSIDMAGSVDYPSKTLPIHPYVLGVWLGDGSNGTGRIDTADQQILDEIESIGYKYKHWESTDYGYNIIGLCQQLTALGIQKPKGAIKGGYNKYIPIEYLHGSIEQREDLLKGLMDTDGSVVCRKSGGVEISLCDSVLAEDVWELIKSLGYKCTMRKDPATLNGVQVGWRWRMFFTPWRPVFKLERKLSLQQLRDNPSARQRCRYITAIESVDSVPVKCISVDSENNLYLAGNDFIPTHNTHALALKMLHYACTTKRSKTLIMAPMKAHVELIWKEVMMLIDDAPSPIIKDSMVRAVKSPQFHIGFSNGSELSFFTTGMKSGGKADVARGQEAGLIILDEFDYMAPDDLEALIAMLQNTAPKNYVPKELIGASTPTGRKEKFYEWSHSARYKEFYYPSYCNPEWTDEIEEEFREEYLPMPYRHEIEADWGEDTEGVYPRKNVDKAFINPAWEYSEYRSTWNSEYIIGVDWDKYGAGTNIVVLELCKSNYDGDERFKNRVRVAYREETPKEEFSLLASTQRLIQLNELMRPSYIYIDRGYGDVQLEILKKHGVENPHTGLKEKVIGIQFAETIEIRDPATKMLVKKEIKPYMIDNLYRMFETEQIMFPGHDEQIYMQIISYVVTRYSIAGRPVFGPSGSQVDHAHDALILACLGVAQHYGEFNTNFNYARRAIAVSNEAFLPMFTLSDNPDLREHEQDIIADSFGSADAGPIHRQRAMTARRGKSISRRSF